MRSLIVLILATLPLSAQVGRGTLFESLSPTQNFGVSAVGLPGNPSITTNEVIAWSQGAPNGSARSMFNAQALGILMGDVNGNGFYDDLPDIDALALPPGVTFPNNGQPAPWDIHFSVANDVQNRFGLTVAKAGDVLAVDAIGSFRVVYPEAAFQSALGTNARLNLDALAELADGSLMVSFRGTGSGNNIAHPGVGSTGLNVPWNGADTFIIPAPVGTRPAIFAYRGTELDGVVSFYYGASYTLTEVEGLESQPGTSPINNPNDVLNRWQGGRRPMPLWLVGGDDAIFCWNNTLNPLSTGHNFYAFNASNSQNFAGFSTNTGTTRVIMDAFAIGDFTLMDSNRVTLDVNDLTPTAGSNLTVFVSSLQPAGTLFQVAISGALASGTGLGLGSGMGFLALDVNDPILAFSLSPGIAPLLVTSAADNVGSAQTVPLVVPMAPGLDLYFQAVGLSGGGFPMSTPIHVKVQ